MDSSLSCTKADCTEEFCIEDHCTEASCIEEEEDASIGMFVTEMAFGLIQGMMTPDDIYEGMVEANCGNKEVARIIRDRAVAEAKEYIETYGDPVERSN